MIPPILALFRRRPACRHLCRWVVLLLVLTTGAATAEPVPARIHADLTRIGESTAWTVFNRTATLLKDDSTNFVRLNAGKNEGLAWWLESNFAEGTIELDVRGRDAPGQSFVGLAFRGEDDRTYDAVYFRPFNFRIADPARRARAVQYISMPQFPWETLRANTPGKYEQPVSPAPDPDGWFHVRIVLSNRKVSVYVGDTEAPCLVVTELSQRTGGKLGLWVGNGLSGDFANLKIVPAVR